MADLFSPVMRYDMRHDELVPVTEEWVASVQKLIQSFGYARKCAKLSVGIDENGILVSPDPRLKEFLEAWGPEFEQREARDAQQKPRAEEDHGRDRARLDSSQEQQSQQNPREGRARVQQGRSSKSEAPGCEGEVAVAYAVTVDGWIEIKHKAIRNPNNPLVVWMLKSTWEHLATHADERGLFYIPCQPGQASPEELRLTVNQKEIADGS